MHIQSIPALSNLYGHGAGHHVSGGQVFGIGCVALHEAFSLTVDQDPSLTTATLCDQTPSSIDPWKVNFCVKRESCPAHTLLLLMNTDILYTKNK